MRTGKGTVPAYAIATVLLVLLGCALVWPLWIVLRGGFWVEGHFTGRYLAEVFRNPVYVEGLVNSLCIAAGTTILSLLLGVPAAWLAHRYDFPAKRLFTSLLLVPMVLPPFVGAIGLQKMLGPYGAVNALLDLGPIDWLVKARYAGVILLQALYLYPIVYLNAAAALANVDPALDEAAANLGCSGFRKFRRITLPLIMPGIFAGGVLVFVAGFTELGTPLVLNYSRCASVQVYDAIKEIGSSPFPYALVGVMLAVTCGLFVAGRLAFGRGGYAMVAKSASAQGARRIGGARSWAIVLFFSGLAGLAMLPHVGVVLTSLAAPGSWYHSVLPGVFTSANYREALAHELTLASIRNSLVCSGGAVLVDVVIGLAVAWLLVRTRIRLRWLVDVLVMIPLAVPGLVIAFGYLAISSQLANCEWVKQSPFWSELLDVRVNPTFFLIISYAVRRLPYMVRALVAGFQQTSESLEEAAALAGAGPFTQLRRITVPLIGANLVAGSLLCFAFSMLEVSDSLMLAQRAAYYPITKTIYELLTFLGSGVHLASALGVWAMVFLAVTLIGCGMAFGRRMGVLFRA